MKSMMRKVTIILMLVFLMSSVICNVVASTLADPVFDSISTSLSSSKTVTFIATTFDDCNSISITRVRLYKRINNVWTYQGDLPLPTNATSQPDYYFATADYSDDIGTGTYRLYTTFCADGHNTSGYSNTRTF